MQQNLKIHIIYLGIGIGLVVIITSPLLFFGKALAGGDMVNFQYPAFYTFWKSLRGEGSILWDQLRMGGFPLYIGQYGGLTDPVNKLLFIWLPFFLAYHARVFLDLLLAFVMAYACIWRLTSSRNGALIGSVTYTCCQFVWQTFATYKYGNILFFIPALFLCVRELTRETSQKNRFYWIAFGGLFGAWVLVSGDVQIFIWTVLAAGVFALVLSAHRRIRIVLELGAALLIGGILSHRYILASLAFSTVTARAGGVRFADAGGGDLSFASLVKFILPHFTLPYVVSTSGSVFFGTVPLLLVGFSLWQWKRLKRESLFFAGLFFVALVAMLPYSPVFWLLHQLPILRMLRGSYTFLPLFLFSAAVLAGRGLALLTEEQLPDVGLTRVQKAFSWGTGMLLGAGVLGTLATPLFQKKLSTWVFTLAWRVHPLRPESSLSLTDYRSLLDQTLAKLLHTISLQNLFFLLPVGVLGAGVWTIRQRLRQRFSSARTAGVLIAATILNLVPLFMLSEPLMAQKAMLAKPPTAEAIAARYPGSSEVGRVFAFLPNDGVYKKLTVPFGDDEDDATYALGAALFNPATHAFFGLASIDGYESFMPSRTARVLAELGSERATTGDLLAIRDIPLAEKQRIFVSHLNTLSMLGVRYVASVYPFDDANMRLVGAYPVTRHAILVYLYELSHVLPQAHLAPNVFYAKTADEAFVAVMDPEMDFSQRAIIECSFCADGTGAANSGVLQIRSWERTSAEFTVTTEQSQWLVFSQNHLPGWHAVIDGKPADLYTANYVFQAVRVPAGRHTVQLHYDGIPLRKF